MNADQDIRVVVIGCGAVAELGHLPALRQTKGMRLVALVDKAVHRAHAIRGQANDVFVTAEIAEVYDIADLAIIATPPRSHVELASGFVQRGIPVLVEKPLALSSVEAASLLDQARASSTFVAVSHVRRFFPMIRFARDILFRGRALGKVKLVRLGMGAGLDSWPFASGYALSRTDAGGGALMNYGPHLYDTLLWWLGDLNVASYEDDSCGGMDVNCRSTFTGPDGVLAEARMSYEYAFQPDCRIETENAIATFSAVGREIVVRPNEGPLFTISLEPAEPVTLASSMRDQLENISAFIRGRSALECPGSEAARVVKLLEDSYIARKSLKSGWVD